MRTKSPKAQAKPHDAIIIDLNLIKFKRNYCSYKFKMLEDENEALVIDIGTGHLKAGFCFEDAPKHMIPMVLGQPKNAGVLVGMDQKDWYIGEEAQEKAQHLILRHPVEKGRIKDSDAIQDINNILQNLMTHDMLINPEEYKFMVTEPPNNPREIREEFVSLMFEELKVPALYMGNQAVLSLFATGRRHRGVFKFKG